jgi:hypothetical protein
MSIGTSQPPLDVQPPAAEGRPHPYMRWHKRVLGFCLVIFALELGFFLVAFPWRAEWEMNWIPVHSRRFAQFWLSGYFRGAVSGLGLLDLWVAGAELSRQVSALFARKTKP